MNLVGIGKKKVKNNEWKNELKEIWHLLEAIEFARKKNDKNLSSSYEAEVIQRLMKIKNDPRIHF